MSGFTLAEGSVPASDGANVYIENGSPVISNNTIRGGKAQRGAGIFMVDSSATLVNNRILNNRATAGSPSAAQGGGIYVLRGAPAITNNLIQENIANTVGFAVDPQSFAAGGGVVLDTDTSSFTANMVFSNVVSGGQNGCLVGPIALAGGINTVRSTAILQDNVIRGQPCRGKRSNPRAMRSRSGWCRKLRHRWRHRHRRRSCLGPGSAHRRHHRRQ